MLRLCLDVQNNEKVFKKVQSERGLMRKMSNEEEEVPFSERRMLKGLKDKDELTQISFRLKKEYQDKMKEKNENIFLH